MQANFLKIHHPAIAYLQPVHMNNKFKEIYFEKNVGLFPLERLTLERVTEERVSEERFQIYT